MFSWQCQNLCLLNLAFIPDWRVTLNNSLRDGSYPLNEISLAQTHATLCYYYASKTYRCMTHTTVCPPMYVAVAEQFFYLLPPRVQSMFQVGCQINPIAITLHFSAPIGPFTHNCPKIFASAPVLLQLYPLRYSIRPCLALVNLHYSIK